MALRLAVIRTEAFLLQLLIIMYILEKHAVQTHWIVLTLLRIAIMAFEQRGLPSYTFIIHFQKTLNVYNLEGAKMVGAKRGKCSSVA